MNKDTLKVINIENYYSDLQIYFCIIGTEL